MTGRHILAGRCAVENYLACHGQGTRRSLRQDWHASCLVCHSVQTRSPGRFGAGAVIRLECAMKRLSLLVTILVWLCAGPATAQSLEGFEGAFPDTMKASYNVQVKMRDGVHLSTDVYLPEPEGQFPTLLVRDMYSNGSNALRQRYARFATANGYAFVFQSVRGRYDSEGKWYPYFQEIDDGDDTLTWIAEQPWSNARVGMFGSSYLGSVQWLAALSGNPALQAIAPAVSPGNYYRDVAYPGGAFSLLSRARWGIGLSGSRTNMTYPIDWVSAVDHLPLETLASSVGFDVPHFQDWLNHPTYDDYWKPLNLEARAPEMSVPALNIGGWYDVFQRSTIGSYQTMREEAATSEAREGQRLLVGPWTHGWNQGTTIGDLDFGADSQIAVEPLLLEWFDHWLKDGPPPQAAAIRIFVMGENVWRDEPQWPLADTRYTSFYLHSDGGLSETSPAVGAGPLEYTYDPADPVPTLGGNIMDPSLRGPHDQGPLDDRADILRFTTQPFDQPTEITGPIRAEIYAASSAPDTDFMAKLVVLRPDGTSFNLVDGVIRARFREGFEAEKLIEPDEIYRYEIDLWATSYLIAPGERLRIDITSSNFPRLARNLNTGAEFARTSEFEVARQQIHASAAHPSRVILPVVPRG
ncbi:MAG: CocE/NonD family hydrolase [Gammaproteobacteria bacterium]|nr:MAG: CocE/NonD family hydrolase [Gammaproteobacteria bacterium]